MISNRQQLQSILKQYIPYDETEQAFVSSFLTLLEDSRCFYRDHLPGHITGSCWIVNQDYSRVLLTHHAKLNRWLQPGGHADGEEDIMAVARREVLEETGLQDFSLVMDTIFDLDIHVIPARNEFPEHLHYDVRFLLRTSDEHVLHLTHESHDLRWFKQEEIASISNHNQSMLRMNEKVQVMKITAKQSTPWQKR